MLSRQVHYTRLYSAIRLASSSSGKSPFKPPKHLDRAATTLQEKYDVLGVENWATKDDLKKAFMERVKENHPDRFRGENESKPVDMDIITTAYDDLKAITHSAAEVQTKRASIPEPTIEEYRQGKYDKKHLGTIYAKVLPYMVVYIPLAMLAIDYAWDKLTDREGRNERALKNYEEKLYRQAIEEWNAERQRLLNANDK